MRVTAGAKPGANSATGSVVETIYVGGSTRVVVDLDAGQRVNVMMSNEGDNDVEKLRGATVTVSWSPSDVVTLASEN
jgi:putative spermidine/putrescine transport system ATP-binding protein